MNILMIKKNRKIFTAFALFHLKKINFIMIVVIKLTYTVLFFRFSPKKVSCASVHGVLQYTSMK